jgi:PhoH-like ATPase
MADQIFILDTNILLQDPKAYLRFGKSTIVVPMPVLEEIDNKKKSVGEVGNNARLLARDLSEKQLKTKLIDGVELENGAILKIGFLNKGHAPSLFPPDSTRHKVLAIAEQMNKEHGGVVLVSKDFLLRVKAHKLGLKTQDYDLAKGVLEKISRPIRRIQISKNELDHFYKDGFLQINETFYANEYCLLTCEENEPTLCRYHAKKERMESLLPLPKDIWGIQPLNMQQRIAFDLLLRDDIKLIALLGPAGTGKTLLALAVALRKIFDEGVYRKILVSRPIVPLGKDIGYLPGTKEEKLYHWMQPIYDNLEYLCGSTSKQKNMDDETLKWLQESKKIEMEAVTYIRGRSLPQMFIIIDEAQNLTLHEVKTIISRAGAGTKVILTGDPFQIDHPYLDKDSNGLTYTINQFLDQSIFGYTYLERTERSELAKVAAQIM